MIDELSAPVGTVVRANCSRNTSLTLGKYYVVERWANGDVEVIGDDGLVWYYSGIRFDLPPHVPVMAPHAGTANGLPPWSAFSNHPSTATWTFADEFPTKPPAAPSKKAPPKCPGCQLELCADLDAYYGKDEFLAMYCTKCRRPFELSGLTFDYHMKEKT